MFSEQSPIEREIETAVTISEMQERPDEVGQRLAAPTRSQAKVCEMPVKACAGHRQTVPAFEIVEFRQHLGRPQGGVATVHAVRDQRLVNTAWDTVPGQPQPQVPVWHMGQRLIEAADTLENVSANDYVRGAGRHGVVVAECVDHRLGRQWASATLDLQLRIHHDATRVGPVAARRHHTRELAAQLIGTPEVVVVAERYPLRRCF